MLYQVMAPLGNGRWTPPDRRRPLPLRKRAFCNGRLNRLAQRCEERNRSGGKKTCGIRCSRVKRRNTSPAGIPNRYGASACTATWLRQDKTRPRRIAGAGNQSGANRTAPRFRRTASWDLHAVSFALPPLPITAFAGDACALRLHISKHRLCAGEIFRPIRTEKTFRINAMISSPP